MMSVEEHEGQATSLARVRALTVAAITALTAVAIFAGVTGSVGPLIAVFVLVCPGLALVGAVRLRDPLFAVVVGVAVSVSIAGLLATIELFVHAWAPLPTLSVLVAIAVGGLLLDADLVPRRLWVSAAARSSAAASGLRRRLEGLGSSGGEPGEREAPVALVSSPTKLATPASSRATPPTPASGPAAPPTHASSPAAGSMEPALESANQAARSRSPSMSLSDE